MSDMGDGRSDGRSDGSIDDRLAIQIITYNRAPYLDRTLAQLLASPFARCTITVLDNCSGDDTPEVCARYRPLFHDLRTVRHKRNIGACPNYLRAVELAEAPYTWVLCDDDTFDFADCGDVLAALQLGRVDLIPVGPPGVSGWRRGAITTSANLANRGSNYFYLLSFLPNMMFKTALFDSVCIAQGYRAVTNMFPHFAFLDKSVREEFSVYVSRRNLVYRGEENNYLSRLSWFTSWVNNCRTIEDRKLRRAAIYELAAIGKQGGRFRWLRDLALWIVEEKVNAPERVYRQIGQILLGLSSDQRFLVFLLSPLVLLPAPAYRLIRRARRAARGKPYPAVKQSADFFRL